MHNLQKNSKNHSTVQPLNLSNKNGFTIIEVVVVFLMILGVTFLILPKSLNSTKQAKFISKWTEKYSELEYMFSVIKAQKEEQLKKGFTKAENNDERKQIILDNIKPYLRITSKLDDKTYKVYYMNKTEVGADDKYAVKDLYSTNADEIVGLKWVGTDCSDSVTCAIMTFDLNGILPPNTWGYDIFGASVSKEKIAPLGKDLKIDELEQNCSKHGYGVYCSYYYLIGGRFD